MLIYGYDLLKRMVSRHRRLHRSVLSSYSVEEGCITLLHDMSRSLSVSIERRKQWPSKRWIISEEISSTNVLSLWMIRWQNRRVVVKEFYDSSLSRHYQRSSMNNIRHSSNNSSLVYSPKSLAYREHSHYKWELFSIYFLFTSLCHPAIIHHQYHLHDGHPMNIHPHPTNRPLQDIYFDR